MTEKTISLHTAALRQAEFGQLIAQFLTDLDSSQVEIEDDLLTTLVGDLRKQLALYHKTKETVVIINSADDIASADEHRDQDLSALLSSITPFATSRYQEEKEAYALLKPLFDTYRTTARANYESETAEINHLLKQTEDETISSAIESLGLSRFIKRLKASQETFVKLYNERSTVKAKQTVYDQKTIRKELMAIYQDLIELVGIYQRRKTSTDYRPLIKVINNSRKTYADLIARRKGVAKKASTATAVKDA